MLKLKTIIFIVLISPMSLLAEELPSQFKDNLIFLTPELADGTSLLFFTDTGGGWNAISKEISEKYNFRMYEKQGDNSIIQMVDMPTFKNGVSIPKPGINNWFEGRLQVVPKEKLAVKSNIDGFLGGRWHAEKIIEFNYLRESISNLSELPDITNFSKIKLGFQKNSEGQYTMAFPSIDVEIDGKVIPMLFDTGASAWPSSEAREKLGLSGQQVATSFIIASVFDSWRKENPDWVVIDNGCSYSKAPMIKVPTITLGGRKVGPVWFTRREDRNFHDYMSSMMDRKIDGALGGSALQYFQIIVDYPNEMAYVRDDL